MSVSNSCLSHCALASISACTRCLDLDVRPFRSGTVDKRKVYLFILEEIRQSPSCQRIHHATFLYLTQKFIVKIDYWSGISGRIAEGTIG